MLIHMLKPPALFRRPEVLLCCFEVQPSDMLLIMLSWPVRAVTE